MLFEVSEWGLLDCAYRMIEKNLLCYCFGLIVWNSIDVAEATTRGECDRVGVAGRVDDGAFPVCDGLSGVEFGGSDISHPGATREVRCGCCKDIAREENIRIGERRTEDGSISETPVSRVVAWGPCDAIIARGEEDGNSLETELEESIPVVNLGLYKQRRGWHTHCIVAAGSKPGGRPPGHHKRRR